MNHKNCDENIYKAFFSCYLWVRKLPSYPVLSSYLCNLAVVYIVLLTLFKQKKTKQKLRTPLLAKTLCLKLKNFFNCQFQSNKQGTVEYI